MTRIIQQLSLMISRTAAKEALTTTQGLTMKSYESACKIIVSQVYNSSTFSKCPLRCNEELNGLHWVGRAGKLPWDLDRLI